MSKCKDMVRTVQFSHVGVHVLKHTVLSRFAGCARILVHGTLKGKFQ